VKSHSEAAFESLIEEHLLAHGGYVRGEAAAYDPHRGLLPADLLGYVEATQPKVWAKQRQIHGDSLPGVLLDAFDKATALPGGVLAVLRHGFKLYGDTIRVATFQPAHGKNPEVEALYAANRVAVARQLHHDPKKPGDALDLAIFLNGIPVATAELKNALTDQDAADARRQYRDDRDPDSPIFRFGRRALVHFAVGSDEVWMTTRLARQHTRFIPFNRGNGTGGGNPPVEGKHRTSYLWEEVWARDSLLDLLARFLHVERKADTATDGGKSPEERLVFPRYHQLDCVRKLVTAARAKGAGTNYLVQHSAGSGKSNSIAWLAHRLASLHDEADRKVFDGVVVVTDRIVLDQQLQDTIYQIDHKHGVVQRIHENSKQLAEALEGGVPIVVTTLHKFGFLADKIAALPERRYAVIVDEAHSSHSGEMTSHLKEILASSTIAEKVAQEIGDDDLALPDQLALRAAIARGPQPNLSFFAFTATPKYKTLELFGHEGPDGKPAPFHLYSMRQAIEERHILDVLRGYTTYERFFQLVKAVADDPELDRKKASQALARFVSLHPVNVAQKVEVIVEHFRSCVMNRLGGRAKAMVVTGSRLQAVKYKLAVDDYLAEKGYGDMHALVAFSGEVKDPDDPATVEKPYTEPEMNRHPVSGKRLEEKQLPTAFESDAYNLLIVANKYQTGFDQPLLSAMYVDKRLAGIQAVQTLSRLNRTHPGKEETFVLDFVNAREEILASFQQYYEGTTVADEVDPQTLYALQAELDATHVWHQPEVDLFARIFYKPQPEKTALDNARLNAALDPAVDRFAALEEEPREAFRGKLQAFCNLYGFLAQVVPFFDVDLEKLYAFGRMLLRKLPQADRGAPVDLGDDVALHYYRLEKQAEGSLVLEVAGAQKIPGPSEIGTGAAKHEKEALSKLIDRLNERFGTDFDAQDLIDGVTQQLIADASIQQAARANDKLNFGYVFNDALDEALIGRHANHRAFIDALFSNEEMLKMFRRAMLDDIYRKLELR
jgi:type I restriction enzyme R subunit